ncbi:glycosyltransferase family 4 protein [Acetomicrobium sp.]|uniref:glycosyltransferase family 4 protein n=1 Tax=Acetomicrobium sp. TaxID=1872099 RepID=UPI00235B6787|nr:glycosyltransferase family 4 protein [Acetomicrobium sp.]
MVSLEGTYTLIKVAIVHDWLVTYAGAERLLEEVINCFPKADLFAIVDFVPQNERGFLKDKPVKTSFIQKLPLAKKKYRAYLPFMPLAVEQFDLSGYDIVISSSHAVAKGVITGPDQLHISYVHSPMRYAWDLQHQYLKETGLDRGLKGWLAKRELHKLRMWDLRTANGVDHFLANSRFIARRIWKVYRREATVIYPPVDIDSFTLCEQKEDFFLTASRMVPYKKIDLIAEAFSLMPDKRLYIIGDGPDFDKVKSKAGANVELLGYQPFEVLRDYMQRAKAFVFAAEEDFGIVPVEAQACGTPVIAYGKGGALETVTEGETGLFFDAQTTSSIIEAVQRFEDMKDSFIPAKIREKSLRFSRDRFKREFMSFVNDAWKKFKSR